MASLVLALVALSAAAQAEPPERHRDLIHSDLPLWGNGSGATWPRAFSEGDSFGCTSRMPFGDWRYEELDAGEDPTWYRVTNYGAFHCFMMVRDAEERIALSGREANPAFLIELGTAIGNDGPVELWLLQRGARPGSDYLLLARRPAPGRIESFDILQRECPGGRTRDGPGLGILLTRYCAINSRRELAALARRMARRPPLARLTFAGPVPEAD
jgi:hypothetical protein